MQSPNFRKQTVNTANHMTDLFMRKLKMAGNSLNNFILKELLGIIL